MESFCSGPTSPSGLKDINNNNVAFEAFLGLESVLESGDIDEN